MIMFHIYFLEVKMLLIINKRLRSEIKEKYVLKTTSIFLEKTHRKFD